MVLRFFRYWATEYLTEKLLESPAFHRFAAKTHRKVSQISNKASPYVDEASKRANIFVESFKENLRNEAQKKNWPKL
ncbi:4739_t:CDS:2 [Paraglomus occultum]|uniref:4739_t:CDS:1 n=1 Tax=Paraglomus occultum TaxID=144539 RepID=A0A9N9C237_9GLOM|nr:4739_t:CDS:2 [Paraglomus occultum]